MRKRNRSSKFFKNALQRLGRLGRSILRLFRNLFALDRNHPKPSGRSQNNDAETYDQSYLNSRQVSVVSRPTPFLLGLEDMQDLEFLTTREFIQKIEWNAESEEILPVKEEDLTLLEDLLINFPEA
ncbi:hypothetical protein [Pseudanabaena sp. Chao 1811]|uniref:hypothetical protein n=1 Tax=Pseudanabaena sp. Chao 1811 TaxID=2963092 RepID=UPI0022F40564|nr:hypothetical protein [Pseudanabaena sp. Chao 1811]